MNRIHPLQPSFNRPERNTLSSARIALRPLVRRSFFTVAAATALVAGGVAGAQTKTLYIGMNGGTMEKAYTQYVFPAFEKLNNVKVVVVPGLISGMLPELGSPMVFIILH